MAKSKSSSEVVEQHGYTPSDRERAALERFDKRRKDRRKFPALTASSDGTGTLKVKSKHSDELVAQAMQHDALGTVDPGELTALMKGVFNFTTGTDGQLDINAANEALQLIVGMEPRNTLEAMLATQMTAIHLAAMDAARRMHRTPLAVEVVAVNSKVLNNLTRTFALQAEAMKKLKGGGQQKVIVEHKHYYLAPGAIANSNAVLGNVSQGRGTNEISAQPHEHAAGVSERSTVHGNVETNGMPLPSPGSEGMEGLPLPWGPERSTKRAS